MSTDFMEQNPSQMSSHFGQLASNHVNATLAYWDKNEVCRFANVAYLDWFGKSSEELVNKMTLRELLGAGVYEQNASFIQEALKGNAQQFERTLKIPTGEIKNAIANYYPDIVNGEVQGFFVHVSDITHIKKLENELAASETKFKSFLDSAPDATIIVNQNGEIQIVNVQTEKIFGYQRHELIGQSIEKLIPERFVDNHQHLRMGFASNPHPREMGAGRELFGLHKNGTEIPVEVSISPIELEEGIFVAAAIRDISQRKKTEEKLQEITERFSIATQTSGIGIWDYDIINNHLVWDDTLYKLYGITRESFAGVYEAWKACLHPEDLVSANKEVEDSIYHGKKFDTEFRVIWPDGSIRNIKSRATVQRNDDGKALRMIGTNWDITQLKNAETELNESNNRSKIFIEQAPNAIAMFDTEIRYLAASKKWIADYKLEGINIVGKSHYEIFPEIGDDWKKIHQDCLLGAINQSDEAYFKRADGTEQWITWDVRPWFISEGKVGGLLMYTADISHIKQKDREKIRIEEILDKTNEVARIGTWEVDLEHEKVIWSRVTKEIHGVDAHYEPELSTAINFFKEGESRDKIQTAVAQAIKDGTAYDVELELVTAKGNIVWARAIGQAEFSNGSCKRLYGVFQDITKIKEAEIQVNLASEELKAIFNSGHVCIITTDTNGLITHFNTGAKKLLQYSAEEMISIHTPEIIHLKKEIIERSNELSTMYGRPITGFDTFVEVAKNEEYDSGEWTYVRKDGSTFPVQLVITAIRDNQGKPTGFLGVAADITELKKAESEMKSLLEISNDQNERLKNFAHIVSHNLRSHSGNIEMMLDLYVEETPGVTDNPFIPLLVQASKNLKETIENLNEVVAINIGADETSTPINLYKSLQSATNNVVQLAKEARVTIINDVAQDITILGLPAYVDSILLNFITNGIKYRSMEREAKVYISATIENGFVILSVQDNGLGIDLKRNGSKLFGMYKTFHKNKDARGIGLFITKNQIEAMGGKVEVESEVDKGTTFKIYFKHEKN